MTQTLKTPPRTLPRSFDDAAAAVAELQRLYDEGVLFLQTSFADAVREGAVSARYRAFYPEIRVRVSSFGQVDSRLSFGHVAEPGSYATTVTRPDLFANYLTQQIGLLIRNHGVPIEIGQSETPIPLHLDRKSVV